MAFYFILNIVSSELIGIFRGVKGQSKVQSN